VLAVSVFWKTLPVVVVVVGVCIGAIRRFKLPFVTGVYFKVLAAVALVAGIAWTLVFTLSDYEIMPADYGGTVISSLIFSYLLHLWIIPIDDALPEEFQGDSGDPAIGVEVMDFQSNDPSTSSRALPAEIERGKSSSD